MSEDNLARTLSYIQHLAVIHISGHSMWPTLDNGQIVLATNVDLERNQLQRGDIVSLRLPGRDPIFIKRIVGMPGEIISLEDGIVYINGSVLHEPYAFNPSKDIRGNGRSWEIEPQEFFVIGDNRGDSEDSRRFGTVAQTRILRKIWFRCWPLTAVGRL